MLEKKIVLVTGASGAIASQICTTFADLRATVVRLDRHAQANTDTVVDLSDPSQTQAALQEIVVQYGKLDAVIHTVGGFAMQAVGEYSPELLPKMLEANLYSTVHLAMAALPALEVNCCLCQLNHTVRRQISKSVLQF
jgi:NAD(P)-dependent dehydrogenase (short-subunit alcohol dehydrogenase family)